MFNPRSSDDDAIVVLALELLFVLNPHAYNIKTNTLTHTHHLMMRTGLGSWKLVRESCTPSTHIHTHGQWSTHATFLRHILEFIGRRNAGDCDRHCDVYVITSEGEREDKDAEQRAATFWRCTPRVWWFSERNVKEFSIL